MRVFGIPVHVRPMFWFFTVLLGLPRSFSAQALLSLAIWVGVVFVSILVHELGHAFMMRRYRYEPWIELYGMGGATHFPESARPTPKENILISLAGPGAGFVLAAIVFVPYFFLGPRMPPVALEIVSLMLYVNLFWGVLNLMPMLPWDGGHVMKGLLDVFTKGRGAKPAGIITMVVAVGLGALAISEQWWWGAMLCLLSIFTGWRVYSQAGFERAPARVHRPVFTLDTLWRPLEEAGPEGLAWLALAPLLPARVRPPLAQETSSSYRGLAKQGEALAKSLEGADRARALEGVAWCWLVAGELGKAQAIVQKMAATHAPSPFLEAVLAARAQRLDQALAAARELESDPDVHARVMFAIRVAEKRFDDAARAVQIEGLGRETRFLAESTLFYLGSFDLAASLAERTFELHAHPDDAYNAACSHARAGRARKGLEWLARAVEAGYADAKQIDEDEDLAPVRELDGFQELRARLET